MAEDEITFFAETNYRNQKRRFGIKTDDRRRHVYVIGKTGMGKSTLLENLIMEDIDAGRGIAVVDPHGDLVETIINYIPSNRINDVVYFNPADTDFPIAFNIVETVDPRVKHIVASGLIGVFKKIWADSWGPRLEYLLRNAILALLDYPGSTLLGIIRILADKSYRRKVVEKVTDPVVKSFWVDEFAKYPDKFATEAIAPIQNKVGQFLSNSLIRNIVGQVKSTIDMREIMDTGKIFLVNLSKGRIGEDTSALLGAMLITKLQLAAMSRVDIPEAERKDFYLYVDEFQNFATDSFANILSEARKYHLNLTIAHQYVEQLGDVVRPAVFGNVGTMIVFRIGATDAEELEKEFMPTYTQEDLVNLSKFNMYLRLMIDGVSSDPFSAVVLPPIRMSHEATNCADKIIRVSREHYGRPREQVEDKILRWSMVNRPMSDDGEEKVAPNYPKSNLSGGDKVMAKAATTNNALSAVARQQAQQGLKVERDFVEPNLDQPTATRTNPVQCWNCNKITYVSFVPDGERPVYCKDCLRDIKAQRAAEGVNVPAYSKKEPVVAPMPNEQVLVTKRPVFAEVNNLNTKDLKPINRPGYSAPKFVQPAIAVNPKVNQPIISKPAVVISPTKKEVARVEWVQEQEDETMEKQDIGLSLDTALKMRPVSFSAVKHETSKKSISSKSLKPGQKITFDN